MSQSRDKLILFHKSFRLLEIKKNKKNSHFQQSSKSNVQTGNGAGNTMSPTGRLFSFYLRKSNLAVPKSVSLPLDGNSGGGGAKHTPVKPEETSYLLTRRFILYETRRLRQTIQRISWRGNKRQVNCFASVITFMRR